jgi:hypothetical protein
VKPVPQLTHDDRSIEVLECEGLMEDVEHLDRLMHTPAATVSILDARNIRF